MKIGDLAKATGISVATIRIYEKEGLIGGADRTSGKFRLFTAEHEVRLRFIKQLRDLGFPLDDIRAFLLAKATGESGKVDAAMTKLEAGAQIKVRALVALIERLASARTGAATLDAIEQVFEV